MSRIKSNGIYLNENAFGNGLKNIKKRIEEINGEVSFATNNGTCVTIRIFIYNVLKIEA